MAKRVSDEQLAKTDELWTDFDGAVIREPHIFKRRHAVGQAVVLNHVTYVVVEDKLVEWVRLLVATRANCDAAEAAKGKEAEDA